MPNKFYANKSAKNEQKRYKTQQKQFKKQQQQKTVFTRLGGIEQYRDFYLIKLY